MCWCIVGKVIILLDYTRNCLGSINFALRCVESANNDVIFSNVISWVMKFCQQFNVVSVFYHANMTVCCI